MGVMFSCSDTQTPQDAFESLVIKSLSIQEQQPSSIIIKTSLSFKKLQQHHDSLQLEAKISISSPKWRDKSRFTKDVHVPIDSTDQSPKHDAAAIKLQKVYKSFRTRRQLADCAVLAEQRWWKLLDFALLKRSSVSFFDIDKPETVVSKWSRARTRAAKVGKGLSKDDKAQKLALQHWLEAIDPRHRYGHNLHFYYDSWLHCESKQPFFYWLDVGEGKEVNLEEKCPRSKLQQQCIKYLGPKEREEYEVIVEKGKLMYKTSRQFVDTCSSEKDEKWIFVLSTAKILYVSQKRKGTFQHSSFLAGGATSAAGRLVAENGTLKAIWPHSGHYRPTEENFQEFMSFLRENHVDLTHVMLSPTEGEGEGEEEDFSRLDRKLSDFKVTEVRPRDEENERELVEQEDRSSMFPSEDHPESETTSGKTTAEETEDVLRKEIAENRVMLKENLYLLDEEEAVVMDLVPEEQILKRMNSKKQKQKLQLGKQLSSKWCTGAGLRIGCVRDYPSELQHLSLEQLHLSPRCAAAAAAGPSRFGTHD